MKDKEYYTTRDLVIPKGTVIRNWSPKNKHLNQFEGIVGIGENCVCSIIIEYSDLSEILIHEPEFLTSNKPIKS